MSKYMAQSFFDQLAADYLDTKEIAIADLPEEEKEEQRRKAKARVAWLRKQHDYELDTYYGTDRHKNMRKALRNDMGKGSVEK